MVTKPDVGSTVRAVVRHLEGASADVEVEAGGCGRCHEEGGCGGQQLTQMFCSGPRHYRVDNQIGARVGDHVTVAIAAGSVRKTANIAYGIPLLALVLGAVAGNMLYGDPGAMLGALSGVALALVCIRFSADKGAGKSDSRPYIITRS